ncbi:MAG: family 43 glycosylhydrolase [Prevotella sp.]|nr:family 43 glycosylhydrolase [Prevotella sp.]
MKLQNFVSPKHGSVIHITKDEAKRLENYWNEQQKKPKTIRSGELWRDDGGRHINAHGGGVLKYGDTYYWFGEHKSERTSNALVGVMCYASKDLVNWRNCGVALSVSDERGHDIERGCILERPKVIYNAATKKFCMWFHLELKGQGYNAARFGVAVADRPEGPYKFLYSQRANAETWPVEFDAAAIAIADTLKAANYKDWTPAWRKAVDQGLIVKRDFGTGQMSRDMTLFVDDDGKAYHIFSSEENLTLHIAELTDDYLHHTGRYTRVAPAGHNEAPAIFKRDGTYWMITSGCTGWEPNEARMFSAPSIWGPWTQHPNPCRGPKAEITFGGQSTFILPIDGQYIFMADIWRPRHPIDARYIWLPIEFEDGKPVVRWQDKWSPNLIP